jgi:hypothetical protein
MRATPVGRRNLKQSQQPRNLAFEPFKEDFEWIVNKMKSEQFRLTAPADVATAVIVPDVVIDIERVVPTQGGSFSVLQHGLVSEMLERRNKQDVWYEALLLLIPSSKKGWVLLGVLIGVVLVLASVSQFREVGQAKGALLLRDSFWWGYLAGKSNRLVTVTEKEKVCFLFLLVCVSNVFE